MPWIIVDYLGDELFLERGVHVDVAGSAVENVTIDAEVDASYSNLKKYDIKYRISHIQDLKDQIEFTSNALKQINADR